MAWLETVAGGPRTVYGHVQVGGGHLRLEAQSRTRLQLGRGLLESHAASWLKHQGDSCLSLDEFKQRVAASRGAGGTGTSRSQLKPNAKPYSR